MSGLLIMSHNDLEFCLTVTSAYTPSVVMRFSKNIWNELPQKVVEFISRLEWGFFSNRGWIDACKERFSIPALAVGGLDDLSSSVLCATRRILTYSGLGLVSEVVRYLRSCFTPQRVSMAEKGVEPRCQSPVLAHYPLHCSSNSTILQLEVGRLATWNCLVSR